MTALTVTCPWCYAPAGHPCETPTGGLPEFGSHRTRHKAARRQRWETP